jgi:hypothetical protein
MHERAGREQPLTVSRSLEILASDGLLASRAPVLVSCAPALAMSAALSAIGLHACLPHFHAKL